jgi:hypothetical protein
MRGIFAAFGLLVLLCAAVSADAGPAPAHVDITVSFSGGSPPSELTFVCNTPGGSINSTGAVDARSIKMDCSSGKTCTNANWFYKFNPCYNPVSGYFYFDNGSGQTVTSGDVELTKFTSYSFEMEKSSGRILSTSGSSCPVSLGAILALPLAAFAYRRLQG